MGYVLLLAGYIAAVPVLVVIGTAVGEYIAGRMPASWKDDER